MLRKHNGEPPIVILVQTFSSRSLSRLLNTSQDGRSRTAEAVPTSSVDGSTAEHRSIADHRSTADHTATTGGDNHNSTPGAAGAPEKGGRSLAFPETNTFMMKNSILLPGHPAPQYGTSLL